MSRAQVRLLLAWGAQGDQGHCAETHPKVRGREEQQGAPGPSEQLKVTQKSEQKRPKGFYSVSPGEGQAEHKVSTGEVSREEELGPAVLFPCEGRSEK